MDPGQARIQKGTITLAYDQDAIKTYLSQNLAKKLDQDMVVEKNITNTDGTVLTVTQKASTAWLSKAPTRPPRRCSTR